MCALRSGGIPASAVPRMRFRNFARRTAFLLIGTRKRWQNRNRRRFTGGRTQATGHGPAGQGATERRHVMDVKKDLAIVFVSAGVMNDGGGFIILGNGRVFRI